MDDLEDAKRRARRIVATTEVTPAELLAYLALEAGEIDTAQITKARDEGNLDIGPIGVSASRLRERVEEVLRSLG
jgi:hypothetical protein